MDEATQEVRLAVYKAEESRAMPVETSDTAFSLAGGIEPPYPPAWLCMVIEKSNSLRPNVDAYVTNIDGYGHRISQLLDPDAEDAFEQVKRNLVLDRHLDRQVMLDAGVPESMVPPIQQPTDQEVIDTIATIRDAAAIESARLESFFKYCCAESSFVTLRRQTRQDLETTGNGYWEVLRDKRGRISEFKYLPAYTVRLRKTDPAPVEVSRVTRETLLRQTKTTTRRRFRSFVQELDGAVVFFKEFGDPRAMSHKTGKSYASLAELEAAEGAGLDASEVLHFRIHSPRSPYGIPRWMGALLSVLGSREAEEVNFLYFSNKSVPPLAVLVSGGRMTDQTVKRLQDFIESDIKGKANFHKILVLEADSPATASTGDHAGRARIELRPLTMAQSSDGLFQRYDERNIDKVGSAFRLPRLLRGDSRDFNRATADACLVFAEQQVFKPERDEFDFMVNRKLLPELGAIYVEFVSSTPTTTDPTELSEILVRMTEGGIITPDEARELSSPIWGWDLPRIDADWVTQPLKLTLAEMAAGIDGDDFEEPTEGAEYLHDTLEPRDPTAEVGKRIRPKLARHAKRLIALRNALLQLERSHADKALMAAKADEAKAVQPTTEPETQVIKVPAEVMARFFE